MNTNHLSTLEYIDLLLSDPNYPDGWYDYLEEVAEIKTQELIDTEWDTLNQLWKTKDELWQLKFAGILGSCNFRKTVPILESMIKLATPKVIREALQSLERMDGDNGYTYIPDKEVIAHLDSIHHKSEYAGCRKVIEWLKQRV